MKITLNKANKIRSILEGEFLKVSPFNRGAPQFYIQINNAFGMEEATNRIIAAKKELATKAGERVAALTQLYSLRLLIQRENEKSGVAELISGIAFLNTVIKGIAIPEKRSLHSYTVTLDEYDVMHQKGALTPVGSTTIDIYADLEIEQMTEEYEDLKKQLRDFEEERNAKNHSVLVELPDDMVAFLKDKKLL